MCILFILYSVAFCISADWLDAAIIRATSTTELANHNDAMDKIDKNFYVFSANEADFEDQLALEQFARALKEASALLDLEEIGILLGESADSTELNKEFYMFSANEAEFGDMIILEPIRETLVNASEQPAECLIINQALVISSNATEPDAALAKEEFKSKSSTPKNGIRLLLIC